MRPPMHFAAGDHVDPGDFLFEDRGLRCTKLRVGEIARWQLTQSDQAIEGLMPARDAVRTDHRGGILWIARHSINPDAQTAEIYDDNSQTCFLGVRLAANWNSLSHIRPLSEMRKRRIGQPTVLTHRAIRAT
jgi:hypothetical protein